MKFYAYFEEKYLDKPHRTILGLKESALRSGHEFESMCVGRDEVRDDGVLILRSRGMSSINAMKECQDRKQPFIYIDTGYFNFGLGKRVHRVTACDYQNNIVRDKPADRWEWFQKTFNFRPAPWKKSGDTIVVCLGTDKSLVPYGYTMEQWKQSTVEKLSALHPDKQIVIREKLGIKERTQNQDTMKNFVQSMDTYAVACSGGSGVGPEAVILGYPVYVNDMNAAAAVGQTDFTQDVVRPDREQWFRSISYDQFVEEDFQDGTVLKEMLEQFEQKGYSV